MRKTYPLPASSADVRLLPLIKDGGNEALANLLADLLAGGADGAAAREAAAGVALMILNGIQAYLDKGGDYLAVESLWEPMIIGRRLYAQHGPEAWKTAAELAGKARAEDDPREADLCTRAALLLKDIPGLPPETNAPATEPMPPAA
jgi:hypothetical protein